VKSDKRTQDLAASSGVTEPDGPCDGADLEAANPVAKTPDASQPAGGGQGEPAGSSSGRPWRLFWANIAMLGVWAAIGWAMDSWAVAVALPLAIAVHELGHLVAARRLGFAGSRMVVVPPVGAFVCFEEVDPSDDFTCELTYGWRFAIVAAAGPIVGAAAGLIVALVAHAADSADCFWAMHYLEEGDTTRVSAWLAIAYAFAKVSFIISLISTIPVYPTDAAQFLRALLLARWPRVDLACGLLSVLLLVGLALTGSLASGVICGLVAGLALVHVWRAAARVKRARAAPAAHGQVEGPARWWTTPARFAGVALFQLSLLSFLFLTAFPGDRSEDDLGRCIDVDQRPIAQRSEPERRVALRQTQGSDSGSRLGKL